MILLQKWCRGKVNIIAVIRIAHCNICPGRRECMGPIRDPARGQNRRGETLSVPFLLICPTPNDPPSLAVPDPASA